MLSPENPEPLRRKNKEKIVKNFERFSFQVFFCKEIYLLSGSEFVFYFLLKKKTIHVPVHLLLFKADIL